MVSPICRYIFIVIINYLIFFFSEKKEKIPAILQNIHESIYDIVYNMDIINPPVNLEHPENNISKEYILNLGTEQPQTYTEVSFPSKIKLFN